MKKYYVTTLLSALLATSANAIVYIDDVTIVYDMPPSLLHVLSLQDSLEGYGLFQYNIEKVDELQFEFKYLGIAEINSLFIAEIGEEITPEYVSGTTAFVTNRDVASGTASIDFAPSQTRYLAYWDDRNSNDTADIADNFGWVSLVRVGDYLFASASATAKGHGIVVGETEVIPEPSSSAFMFCLLMFVLGIKRTANGHRAAKSLA